MVDTPLLDMGIAVGAALIMSLLFYRLRLPMMVGQLFAGMLVGPFGLGLVRDPTVIDLLASLGIVLLLFVLGLELDPRDLRKIGFKALILTIIEFMIALVVGILSGVSLLGWTIQQSLFLGAVFGISGTAIIGRVIMDRRGELGQQLVSTIITVMIIEDVIAILLLLITPQLAAGNQVPPSELLFLSLKGALLCILTVGFGRLVAPRIINWLSQYELEVGEATFLLALSFGFLFGVLSAYLGFSPGIGAFLIGLTLLGKHSRYIMEKVSPIKDLFIIFFFVSMGTLIDARSALNLGLPLILLMVGAVAGKIAGGTLGARILRMRHPFMIGAILIPQGEFTLILARAGVEAGLIPTVFYSIGGLAIVVTALTVPLSNRLTLRSEVRDVQLVDRTK